MSVLDIEPIFIQLTKEFEELKEKIDNINKKYEYLENIIQKQKTFQFKCALCKKKFGNINNLKDHKKNEACGKKSFECGECDKSYNTTDQLETHKKIHVKFGCEECDCEFKFERNLLKHMEAVHGNRILYCHFYNNDKDCPFDDECVFAHQDSPDCKYGAGCERVMCMFSHEDKEDDDDVQR